MPETDSQPVEPSTVHDRAKRKLERDLGADVLGVLRDPRTVEVMLNPDGRLWLERLGEQMQCIGTMPAARAQAVIETIAGFHGKEVTADRPLLEAELPLDGSRFAGQLPPVVTRPTFAIRKKAIAVFTLDQYVAQGIMTQRQCDLIREAIHKRRNILVSGGTGSGKTTLINAVIDAMVAHRPTERTVILEDTAEIQCAAVNCIAYHTTAHVSMTDLVKTTLRMRPDRLFVGEVRGKEALAMLMAWNTGHEGGAATIHANNANAALTRLGMLISMNEDYPKPIEPLIGEAVHVIISIARTNDGSRKIQEIMEVSGYSDSQFTTRMIV